MTDRPWVDRALIKAWEESTDEEKANRRMWGPMTRDAAVRAYESNDLPVPAELPWRP